MDPLTLTSSFATIVSLIAEFNSQRRTAGDADMDEFKAWLADQRHHEIISLLESNATTTVWIKARLQESQESLSDILQRLREIELKVSERSDPAGHVPAQDEAKVVEIIRLGANNAFEGTEVDLVELATRCAVYAIEGIAVGFQVVLRDTVLSTPPEDPLMLPRYEKARRDRAYQLESRLELLTSQATYKWWQYFLGRKEDWEVVIQALLMRASLAFDGNGGGKKIDLWRTEEPRLGTAIFLNAQEVAQVLEHLGFGSTADLRFGPNWRAAIDLPLDLIARHVIPSIIVQLEMHEVPVAGEVLNLATWHIGEG
ncbi:hypothetical protein P5Y53_16210 [Dyella jiangningensis]|uniref:hypothetical protein n=1 Tax=Dyella jiangningensis TaxID=1379159 RepID=UPI00240F6E3C|nr:hypothetical protein [Dyella jiangningensis]MDG2539221.1 hypothetical protein [Dyella jiangningensis]